MKKKMIFLSMLLCMLFCGGMIQSGSFALAASEEDVITGQCGENVFFKFEKNTGILCINGTGAMYDYRPYNINNLLRTPWSLGNYSSEIRRVEIGMGVTHVGIYAFNYCTNISSVELPEGVKTIGDLAFRETNITVIDIPDSVETIGNYAFGETPLSEVQWSRSILSIGDSAFTNTNIIQVDFLPCLQKIGDGAFEGCKKLQTISVPDGCEIGYNAFYGCNQLKSAEIGENCKLEEAVFKNCTLLKQVILGEGTIGVHCDTYGGSGHIFSGCTSLESMRLPDSWGFYEETEDSRIYDHQFYGCTALKDIQFNDSNEKYKTVNQVVYSKDGSKLIFYPLALTAAEYEILDGVTKIEAYAFENQEYLENVTIPSGVKKMGWRAFGGCSKLNNVILPEGLEELGGGALAQCDALDAIVLPASLQTVQLSYKDGSHFLDHTRPEVIYGEEGSYAEEWAQTEKWAQNRFQKTIWCSFDANNGTVDLEKKPVIYNDKYHKLPEPLREGYSFLGWYTKKESGYLVSSETIVSENTSHTLYAHWKRDSPYDFGINDLSYSFANSRQAFGYGASYKIPYSRYQFIFGDTVKAKYFYNFAGLWGGSCYGMASTSGMFHYLNSGLDIKSFDSQATRIWDLKISDSDRTGMTITELIESMHISQYDTSIQKIYRSTTGRLNDLYEKTYESWNTGKPVLIGVYGPQGGHALLGYNVEQIGRTEARLYVYDCNFPGVERYITLTLNASGEVIGWYYYLNDRWHWGNEYEGCKINYVPYEEYYTEWENRAMKQTNNVLFLNSDSVAIYDFDDKAVATLANGKLVTEEKDIYMIETVDLSVDDLQPEQNAIMVSVPTDMYTVKNMKKNMENDFKISMVGIDRGVTVTTSSEEITLTVDDESRTNGVLFKAEAGDTYNIVLDSTDEEEKEKVEVSGTGGGDIVGVSQIKGEMTFNNCETALITVDGEPLSNIAESTTKPVKNTAKPQVSPTPEVTVSHVQGDQEEGENSDNIKPNISKSEDSETMEKALAEKKDDSKVIVKTVPKGTKLLKLKAKKKKIIARWKKQIRQTGGYQIQCSTNKKFRNKTKTILIKDNKIGSKKISKLKGGKKYYVRIRTYQESTINGKTQKIYSGWSKIKSVRTKK